MKKPPYIINVHTHIFTIKHVPNWFSKRMSPWFAQAFSIKFIIKLYRLVQPRYNKRLKNFQDLMRNFFYRTLEILRYTLVLDKLVLFVIAIANWLLKVISNLFQVANIFGPESKEAFKRYDNFARFAFYKSQAEVFSFLKKYYSDKDKFVVLPMDMDYMDAGNAEADYIAQMEELKTVKKNNNQIIPFVFLHPKRLTEPDSKKQLDYKEYIEQHKFGGFKLYPPIGYFPFDKRLLEAYDYALEKQLPVITHCSKGPVYYRGRKKKDWAFHPILNTYGKEESEPNAEKIKLQGNKNSFYTTHFTHPLNYECLLNKDLLKNYIGEEKDFSKLKICIAHFGGSNEILTYYENQWSNYDKGIYYKEGKNTLDYGQRYQVWYNASWFTIIMDLIKKYPDNVYADISYTLGEEKVYPILKDIIEDEQLGKNILFGTDFYMIASHKGDKELFHNIKGWLGNDLFYQIAYENPKRFLSSAIYKF